MEFDSIEKPAPPTAEEIYQEYPRRIAKADALRAIEKALRKKPALVLMERTKAYASAISWKERQFIPHPATWFNKECFDDDPGEWLNPNTQSSSSNRELKSDNVRL